MFNLCAWQSFCTTSFQVSFGLPLCQAPCHSYSIRFFTQSLSSFRSTTNGTCFVVVLRLSHLILVSQLLLGTLYPHLNATHPSDYTHPRLFKCHPTLLPQIRISLPWQNLTILALAILEICLGPHNLKCWHVTWPRPFQGWFVICRLGHAMVNSTRVPNLKYLCSSTTTRWKVIQNIEIGVVWGWLPNVIGNITIR